MEKKQKSGKIEIKFEKVEIRGKIEIKWKNRKKWK